MSTRRRVPVATVCLFVPKQLVRRRVPPRDKQGKSGASPALSRNCRLIEALDQQAREPAFGEIEGLRGEGVDRSVSVSMLGMRLLPFFFHGYCTGAG